ncbi:etoposide-induced protein 2.4-domain-containing protein [Gautieria morchelliformis]|nr:etoposide-induced protein 2.4-domain-containing protein [Gautieria morchelliformis]
MAHSRQPRAPWHRSHGQVHLSRSSYPSFLPLPETLRLHLGFLTRGFMDASRWDITVKTVYSDSEIRSHVLKSFILNGLSLVSIYTFDYVLLPLATRGRVHRNSSWLYRVLWLIPLAATSLYLNGSWAGVVAKRSYTLQHGSRSTIPSASYSGMLTALAGSAYRVVMIVTSLILTNALSYVPIIGSFVGFAFLCWVNAFTWVAQGLSLAQRVRFLEERWAYYFSFGLPSATLCAFFPGLAGVALFALLLPYYIIHATNAHPVPKNPYSPVSPIRDTGESARNARSILYPSPFIPVRIPVFGLVIAIDNLVVRLLSVGSPSGSRLRTNLRESMEKHQLSGDPDVAANAEEATSAP